MSKQHFCWVDVLKEKFSLILQKNIENIVWLLKTCVYELNDASHAWYLRVHDELIKLGAKPLQYDPALF